MTLAALVDAVHHLHVRRLQNLVFARQGIVVRDEFTPCRRLCLPMLQSDTHNQSLPLQYHNNRSATHTFSSKSDARSASSCSCSCVRNLAWSADRVLFLSALRGTQCMRSQSPYQGVQKRSCGSTSSRPSPYAGSNAGGEAGCGRRPAHPALVVAYQRWTGDDSSLASGSRRSVHVGKYNMISRKHVVIQNG